MSELPWLIVGQGLAGTCLAWELWWRKKPFRIIDNDSGGSSRVAAGLINPITGKNFEPSKGIAEALPEAMAFYQKVESELDETIWHPMPVLRLATDASEWRKIENKLSRHDVMPWIEDAPPSPPPGWHRAALLKGGGRLDTRHFAETSRQFFLGQGCFSPQSWNQESPPEKTVLCDGAAGLVTGRCGTHRCAKGEILTCRTDHAPDHIRVGAGGWLVPIDQHHFKAGSTYSWDRLDHIPTPEGRRKVEIIASRLSGSEFEVVAHEAGIRPILRRSDPLIGPLESGHWVFNGLGSKGSLHAPTTARRLAEWLSDGKVPAPEHDIRHFLETT